MTILISYTIREQEDIAVREVLAGQTRVKDLPMAVSYLLNLAQAMQELHDARTITDTTADTNEPLEIELAKAHETLRRQAAVIDSLRARDTVMQSRLIELGETGPIGNARGTTLCGAIVQPPKQGEESFVCGLLEDHAGACKP